MWCVAADAVVADGATGVVGVGPQLKALHMWQNNSTTQTC